MESALQPRLPIAIKTRLEQAEARTEQAETRTEQAKSRTEHAETRAEQAETRTESAKTRTEHAEARAEQAEAELENMLQSGSAPSPQNPPAISGNASMASSADMLALEHLTARQKEILQLIARGRNIKEIADALGLSPKTIEYHRVRLMNSLGKHDITGLVRFAIKVGLASATD
jgi:DNA-binding NarL/FixJ family response regulator